MPLLTIHHKTVYRYNRPVAFGEHRIMLRPRDGHDLRVLSSTLEISPEPMSLRWIHDVFGNSVAIATFDERAETLSFTSTATVEHNPAEEFALTPDDAAYFYPFLYDREEVPDLHQFITPQYGDPNGELSAWARQFLDPGGPTPTFDILSGMTHGIRKAFTYRKRHEHGTQHPLDTLQTGSGTCRDYAMFMIEALRRLGIAARFVSGYLFIPGDSAHGYVGGGSTHAWVQVYLPSAGWIEFDPTNGIVGTRDLIRVAVARDPRQAIPLHGCYLGSADAYLGMEIGINVVSVSDDETEAPSEEQREEISGNTDGIEEPLREAGGLQEQAQEQPKEEA
jgi:transglutaminase-like putative cysteine protease